MSWVLWLLVGVGIAVTVALLWYQYKHPEKFHHDNVGPWFFAMLVLIFTADLKAHAGPVAMPTPEEDFCAIVVHVPPGGVLFLHDGPGGEYNVRAKLVLNDFLYADTSRCSIWNAGACTDSYTHIYSVHRLDGAARDNLHGYTGGWVYTKDIRSIDCDRDWGYADPDGPQEDPK